MRLTHLAHEPKNANMNTAELDYPPVWFLFYKRWNWLFKRTLGQHCLVVYNRACIGCKLLFMHELLEQTLGSFQLIIYTTKSGLNNFCRRPKLTNKSKRNDGSPWGKAYITQGGIQIRILCQPSFKTIFSPKTAGCAKQMI